MHLLWGEIKKYRKLLAGALILGAINQSFTMLVPQVFRVLLDDYAAKIAELSRDQFITGVLWLILLGMGLTFVSRVAKAFQDYFVNVITQRAGTSLYAQSVSHAFSLPFAVFEDNRSGEVLNKLQKARTDSQQLIGNTVNILFLSLVGMAFAIAYATHLYWVIGLMFLLCVPAVGGTIFFLSRKIKEIQLQIVKEAASLSGSTTETLRNVELVKSLGLEKQEIDRLNRTNEKILTLELKKVRMVRKLDFIQGTFLNTIQSAIQFVLFIFIFSRTITVGEFMTLWIYNFFIFEPLRALGLLSQNYQETKASLAQLDDFLKIESVTARPDAIELGQLESISFKDVSLAYATAERDALNGISIEVKAGESIAFVGPSGSGKSTMVKLLAGLYTPSIGEVSYNGVSLTELDLDALRRRIGLVAQETQLFAGTVKENLLFVKPQASDVQCLKAIKLAQAEAIIDRTSSGLDTKIGEGGLKLSGGEKQRLAIARALLRDPSLIIFDEATSSLDSITERSITETIKEIKKINPNFIQILVAHRLSTIMHADRIYVFEHGKILETGVHETLVAQGGLYSALWREQTAEIGK